MKKMNFSMRNANGEHGFSLIKIVLALAVVGLIAGLAIVYKNSTHLAEAKQDLAELDKYKGAAAAFQTKYGYFPGDMPAALAAQLKLQLRDGSRGRGDGNGLLEGSTYSSVETNHKVQTGEPFFFWEDLYASTLTKDLFDIATDTMISADIIGNEIGEYLPDAKLGKNRIYVYSENKVNYYGLSNVTRIEGNIGAITSIPGLTVTQASNIDKKIDDGMPGTGKVLSRYVSGEVKSAPEKTKDVPKACTQSSKYIEAPDSSALVCALSFAFQ